jgi:hypothetical protein
MPELGWQDAVVALLTILVREGVGWLNRWRKGR